MSCTNTGAVFVRNYLGREWKAESKQTYWTLLPNQTNMNRVTVLYQFADDLEVVLFRGFQLIFEIRIHEEHPYKAPSVLVFTPNGRMETHTSICIDGLTAWHPESWKIITTFRSIVERFAIGFIDMVNVETGAGFDKTITNEKVAEFVAKSKDWNKAHYPELVATFEKQCVDFAKIAEVSTSGVVTGGGSSAPAPVAGNKKTDNESDSESEINYEYSDDEVE